MAKFFKRLVGGYEEKELLMQMTLDKLQSVSNSSYKKIFIEFKRGDKVERSECATRIEAGESTAIIN